MVHLLLSPEYMPVKIESEILIYHLELAWPRVGGSKSGSCVYCVFLCMVGILLVFVEAATNCVCAQWFPELFLRLCADFQRTIDSVFNVVLPKDRCQSVGFSTLEQRFLRVLLICLFYYVL